MREVTGNLWMYPADVRVITTNGTVKKNGECVMGRGCALEAKSKFEFNLADRLGDYITRNGNHVYYIGNPRLWLYSFPVKHNWYEKADIALIGRSAEELVAIIDELARTSVGKSKQPNTIILPRPGCGNGKLQWEDVKQVLEPILDDRFHVITF